MRKGLLTALALLICLALATSRALAEPDEQSVLAELFILNRSLAATRAALATIEEQRTTNLQQQAELQVERDRLAARRKEREKAYGKRLRYIQEHGGGAPLGLLLSAQSLTDFLARLDMLTLIAKRDAAVIQEIRTLRAAVEGQERLLEGRQAELGALAEQERTRQAQLQAEIDQKEAILSGLAEGRAATEARLAELDEAWEGAALPVLASLGTSLQEADLDGFQPDATHVSLFPPGTTVRISEGNLNRYFLQKVDLAGLTFRLVPGETLLQGDYAGVSLSIRGRFTVVDKVVLRYLPSEITVADFTVPKSILDQIVAEGTLDIDLSTLVKPFSLKGATSEEGFLIIKAGI